MSNSLKMVISSGGTDVPIDDVRCISNFSKGTTGSLIAEEALQRGHSVQYLCSKQARQPFARKLQLDPNKPFVAEVKRLKEIRELCRDTAGQLNTMVVPNFATYHKALLETIENPDTDVALLAMAASDYGVPHTDGKISSDNDLLNLKLEKLPKIIGEVKKTRKNVFLVGFKFLINASPDQLIETAYRSMLRDGQDLAVANSTDARMKNFSTYLISIEKGIIPVPDRKDLPSALLDVIESRYSHNYYKTQLDVVKNLPLEKSLVDNFLQQTQDFAALSLFSPYLEGDRQEFGFVGRRTPSGTLITGRGSSKSQATLEDVALVSHINHDLQLIQTTTTEKKASLNAPLAHRIFESRPEIHWVVHAHINLAESVVANQETAPGTVDDWRAIAPLVQDGKNIIYQPNHGVLILLEKPEDLYAILERNNLYRHRSDNYETAYQRFEKKGQFFENICAQIPRTGKILNFACGTGLEARQLLEAGYQKLVLADVSNTMLAQARKNVAIPAENFRLQTMQSLEDIAEFDGIVIRQAINYLSAADLVPTLTKFYKALISGGNLVFNSFVTGKTLAVNRLNKTRTQADDCVVTREGNLRKNGKILHGQQSHIFAADGNYEHVYDFNSFYEHSETSFVEALGSAGFTNIAIERSGSSLCFIAQKA